MKNLFWFWRPFHGVIRRSTVETRRDECAQKEKKLTSCVCKQEKGRQSNILFVIVLAITERAERVKKSVGLSLSPLLGRSAYLRHGRRTLSLRPMPHFEISGAAELMAFEHRKAQIDLRARVSE